MKVELDISNYATNADLKNAAGFDRSKFANWKSSVHKLDIDKFKNVPTNLSNLKSKIDKLDVDKVIPALVDLSKLSDLVRNNAVKWDVCNAKIKNIEGKIPDITNLATNITLNVKIHEVKKEIPSIINLATIDLNTKINEVKNKIHNVTNLATTTKTLTAVEKNI